MRAYEGQVDSSAAGAVASGEPQRRALVFPDLGESRIIDEPACRQTRGMASFEDRLGDVGGEKGQFHETGEVGTADAGASCDFVEPISA